MDKRGKKKREKGGPPSPKGFLKTSLYFPWGAPPFGFYLNFLKYFFFFKGKGVKNLPGVPPKKAQKSPKKIFAHIFPFPKMFKGDYLLKRFGFKEREFVIQRSPKRENKEKPGIKSPFLNFKKRGFFFIFFSFK